MEQKVRILLVEDIFTDAELIKRALTQGQISFELVMVDSRQGYTDALSNFLPDVILADHSLPSFDSYEALEILHSSPFKIPFILITGNISEEFSVSIIRRGADDFILKDRLERLPTAINNLLEKFKLEKERLVYLEELSDRERRFRSLIENISDVISIVTADGFPKYYSPSMFSVLGYSEDEIIHKSIFDLCSVKDKDGLAILFKEAASCPRKAIRTGTIKLQHKDGSWKYVQGVVTNMLDEPAIAGFIHTFRDVTAEIASDQIRKETESQYQALFENSIDAILLTEQNGRILAANAGASELFGMTELEICERERDAIFDSEDPRLAKLVEKRALEGKVRGELTFKRKDGRKFPGEISSRIYTTAAGMQRTSMVIRDISERKLAEAELIASNRELEQFSYIVSHNLRSPVANILGLTELIVSQQVTEDEKELLVSEILAAGHRLDAVIKDLNKILQIKGKMNEHEEVLTLSEILSGVEQDLEEKLLNGQVQLISDFSRGDQLSSIKSYLFSIFYNLISNSIKYARSGLVPRIEIVSEVNDGRMVITFADNGLGIDLATKGDQVFGLYKRFQTHVAGKGMGLFMVKTQVGALGGKISIDSEVGVGTTFTIEMPLEGLDKNVKSV